MYCDSFDQCSGVQPTELLSETRVRAGRRGEDRKRGTRSGEVCEGENGALGLRARRSGSCVTIQW